MNTNSNKKLALITGASKGIGFELAKVFANNGYDLIINSNSGQLNIAASELRLLGVAVTSIVSDLATREGVDQLYQVATSQGRPVDVLVLNAGVGAGGEFVNNSYQEELNLMNLNIVNLVYLTKRVLKDMVAHNNGKILFTSSIAAEMPAPYNAVYAASKSFVQSFAMAIRYEMRDTHKNIVVTALQPGPTDTEFFERAHMEDTAVGHRKKDDPAKVAQDGFDALMNDQDHVVGGALKNKVQAKIARILPDSVRSKLHGEDSKPDQLKHG